MSDTDFNDLHVRYGLDAVRQQIEAALAAEPEPQPEPTYPLPPGGKSIEDARVELRNLVDEFVRKVLAPPKPTMILRWPLQVCIKAPPGTGKTRAITDRIMALIDAGKKVIFAVPTHALGEQIVRDLEAIGARVYRSRGAPEPGTGATMCLEKDRTVAIVDALGDAERDACKRGIQICDFFEVCAFQRQKRNPPRIWVVAHELLYLALPDFIPPPDVVIIDESFSTKALNKDLAIHVDWLIGNRYDKVAFPVPWGGAENLDNLDLIETSKKAHHALEDLVVRGRRSRISLDMFRHLTAKEAHAASKLEWRRKRYLSKEYEGLGLVYPGQDQDDAIRQAMLRAEHNREVKALATFWECLGDMFDRGIEWSRNLYFEPSLEIDDDRRPGIRIRSRSEMHEWVRERPILYLDATMSETLVRQDLPYARFHNIDVAFPPMEAASVYQVTDRRMTNGWLIPSKGGNEKDNRQRELRLADIRNSIKLYAAWHRDERVAVICQDKLEKKLKEDAPSNIVFAHFNALRGKNNLEDARVMIAVGRTEPGPRTLEEDARLLFDREVAALPDEQDYHDEVTRYLRMRDGSTVAVKNYVHPDEGAEVLRWLACDAELTQAIYRARPLGRTVANPLTIYIMTSVCLPVPVDIAKPWTVMQPSLYQLMLLASGYGATNSPTDTMALFPELFRSVDAAKKALQREPYVGPRLLKRFLAIIGADGRYEGTTSLEEYLSKPVVPSYPRRVALMELFGGGTWPGIRTLKYRRVGSRARHPATFYYIPDDAIDPAQWLRERGCEVTILPDIED
jgi:putative DNA primase/helicase